MRARCSLLPLLFTGAVIAGSAGLAAAHCCHDERMLGAAQQNDLRRGTHPIGRGLGDDDEDSVFVGRGRDHGAGQFDSGGGLGGLQGNGIGNYGAGSIGERGPGGLGALRGDSIFRDPPRPR